MHPASESARAARERQLSIMMEQSPGICLDPGSAVLIPSRLTSVLPADATILLGYLWNISVRLGDKDDGWFCCTGKQLSNDLNMGNHAQARLLRQLTGADGGTVWIKTKSRGCPPKRYVWVDHEQIDEFIG